MSPEEKEEKERSGGLSYAQAVAVKLMGIDFPGCTDCKYCSPIPRRLLNRYCDLHKKEIAHYDLCQDFTPIRSLT